MKVLLVDDDPLYHILVKKILQGHTVDAVETAEEAKIKLKTKKYDLIIVDVLLQRTNGYSLVSYIRTVLQLDTKIVMYSAMPKEKGFDMPYIEKGNLRRTKIQMNNLLASHA